MGSGRRRCVFVLGVHRSGTSTMTGTLYQLGISIGRDLMPATEFNEKGHFENNKVFQLNERILADLGVNWANSYLLKADTISIDDLVKKYADNIRAIIEQEFPDDAIIAIKDPRLSILLPAWQRILEELDFDCVSIVMLRHPVEVAKSFAKRDRIILSKSLMIWLDYTFSSETVTRKTKRIFVNYIDLIYDLDRVLANIRMKLHIDIKENSEKLISNFIDKSLQHHDIKLLNEIPIPPIVSEVFSNISDLTKINGSSSEIYDQIDSLKREHMVNMDLYNRDFIAEEKLHIERLTGTINRLKSEIIDLQGINLTLGQTVAEKEMKVQNAAKNFEVLQKDFRKSMVVQESLKMDLSNSRDEIVARQRTIDELESQIGAQEQKARESEFTISQQLNHLKVKDYDYTSIRNSLSFRIGWLLTRPFGYLYDLFLKSSK